MKKTHSNNGLIRLNWAEPKEKETIIVIGLARGGTSLISGVLDKLGVSFNGNVNDVVYEDVKLAQALIKSDSQNIKKIIQKYNSGNDKWGFKRPNIAKHLFDYEDMFRNPKYVVVFKDTFSIANRRRISNDHKLIPQLNAVHRQQKELLDFIKRTKKPMLLVSYEKAVLHKKLFMDELIDFCDIEPSKNQLIACKKFISPNNRKYNDATNKHAVESKILKLSNSFISGYAKKRKSDKPLGLTFYINGEKYTEISTGQASISETVDKKYKKHCFNVDFSPALSHGDKLTIISENGIEVRESPIKIKLKVASRITSLIKRSLEKIG